MPSWEITARGSRMSSSYRRTRPTWKGKFSFYLSWCTKMKGEGAVWRTNRSHWNMKWSYSSTDANGKIKTKASSSEPSARPWGASLWELPQGSGNMSRNMNLKYLPLVLRQLCIWKDKRKPVRVRLSAQTSAGYPGATPEARPRADC